MPFAGCLRNQMCRMWETPVEELPKPEEGRALSPLVSLREGIQDLG